MKNLFKNINLFGVAAMIATASAVFATAGTRQSANVYNDAAAGQPDHWVDIPQGSSVQCNGANRNCTGVRNSNGSVTPTTDRGFATLIEQ